MQLINAIIRYIKTNGGLYSASHKVTRLSWILLRNFGVYALLTEIRNTLRVRREEVARIVRREALATLSRTKIISILATPHTMYVAHMLQYMFSKEGFIVTIITSPPATGYKKEVHIVICPQMFSRLPKYMISFQMEQSTSNRWFTPRYLNQLKNSLAIFDYSRTNIGFLEQHGIPYGHVFYMPIKQIPDYLDFIAASAPPTRPATGEKTCDVLFYGDANSPRRRSILAELSTRFRIQIVGNLFGPKLYEKLLGTRVVINIHYHENALLETTRICECLSLGVEVISETSANRSEYPELESLVNFTEIGDISGMANAIELAINSEKTLSEKINRLDSYNDTNEEISSFYLSRFLLANGLINFCQFSKNNIISSKSGIHKICLSLPETFARRESFISRSLSEFEIFDGLRHTQSWIGCGLSYKYLITQAKIAGLRQVTICEDDVVIDRKNQDALLIVERYLASLNGDWDVFVGLIAHVHADVVVSQVNEFEGLTFLHLNKMTSMVFNIYNYSIFDLFNSWDELNDDPKTNTIDRYLENKKNLRVITTLPFIVGHSESNNSTLWGFGNEKYLDLISRSTDLLNNKTIMFLESQGNHPDY